MRVMIEAIDQMVVDLRHELSKEPPRLRPASADPGRGRHVALAITALEEAQLRLMAADAGTVRELAERAKGPGKPA